LTNLTGKGYTDLGLKSPENSFYHMMQPDLYPTREPIDRRETH
jgi:hypothetical protein